MRTNSRDHDLVQSENEILWKQSPEQLIQRITPTIILFDIPDFKEQQSQYISAEIKEFINVSEGKDDILDKKYSNLLIFTSDRQHEEVFKKLSPLHFVQKIYVYKKKKQIFENDEIGQSSKVKYVHTSTCKFHKIIKEWLGEIKSQKTILVTQKNIKQLNEEYLKMVSLLLKQSKKAAQKDFQEILKLLRKNRYFKDYFPKETNNAIQTIKKSEKYTELIPLMNYFLSVCKKPQELLLLRILFANIYSRIRQNYIEIELKEKKLFSQKFFLLQTFSSKVKRQIEGWNEGEFIKVQGFLQARQFSNKQLVNQVFQKYTGNQIIFEINMPFDQSLPFTQQFIQGYFINQNRQICFNPLSTFKIRKIRTTQVDNHIKILIVQMDFGILPQIIQKRKNFQTLKQEQEIVLVNSFYQLGLVKNINFQADIEFLLNNKLICEKLYSHQRQMESENKVILELLYREGNSHFQDEDYRSAHKIFNNAILKYNVTKQIQSPYLSNAEYQTAFRILIEYNICLCFIHEPIEKRAQIVHLFPGEIKRITKELQTSQNQTKISLLCQLVEILYFKEKDQCFQQFLKYFKERQNRLHIYRNVKKVVKPILITVDWLLRKDRKSQAYDIIKQMISMVEKTIGKKSRSYVKLKIVGLIFQKNTRENLLEIKYLMEQLALKENYKYILINKILEKQEISTEQFNKLTKKFYDQKVENSFHLTTQLSSRIPTQN